MAISRIGSASAQVATITIPGSYAAGDLIIIAAARNNITAPTVPSGWVTLNSQATTNNSVVCGFKIAQSSSESSGNWANASTLHCVTYRGSLGFVVPSTATAATGTSSATINYPALANYRTGLSDNWYFCFAAQNNSTNSLETAPSGMANLSVESFTGWKSAAHDTNATQASNWASANVVLSTAAVYRSFVIQLFEVAAPAFGGSGGGIFDPLNHPLIN